MDLSIVITNWNTRQMLKDCLNSFVASVTNLETEIYVVDNASDDESAEMVEQNFPDVHLVRNKSNRGFAAANNQALSVARGRNILLLNSDTLVHGDAILQSVDWLDAHPDVGVMGCRVLNDDGTLQATCSSYPSLLNLFLQASGLSRLPGRFFDRYRLERWDRRDERAVDVVSGCFMMVRNAAMRDIGLLDENFFFYGEETDWCRRFAKAGWQLVFAPVGEITHFGGGSVKKLNHRKDILLTEGTVRLHRKHFGKLGGAACWVLLAGFNVSRAISWTVLSALGGETSKQRASHFRLVVRDIQSAWPQNT